MPPTPATKGSGRETRLLLVTIAVSVGALLLLARFRFPEQATQPADPAPAPLERLAARAAFDELASAMADLERRITPRVVVFTVAPSRESGPYAVAPRVAPSRAVAILGSEEAAALPEGRLPNLISHDTGRGLAVLAVSTAEDAMVTPRSGIPRQGPRYVVVVEGTAQGPTLRPVYVGKTGMVENGGPAGSSLMLDAVHGPVPLGAAVFSLEGTFLGLVSEPGPPTILISGDELVAVTRAAQPTPQRPHGDLGIEVQEPSEPLLRAAGAERGVIVSYVRPGGPAAGLMAPGDVLQSIDGTETPTVAAFREIERAREPGEPVTATVVRLGKTEQISLRARGTTEAASTDGPGLTGRSIPRVGIEVVAVQPDSAAARGGFRRGDLILTLNGRLVTDPAALTRSFRALESGGRLVLSIEREGRHRLLLLEKE